MMNVISLGVLFTVALTSVLGCHWQHRSWRKHHDYVYNSAVNADPIGRAQRGSSAET